MADEETDEGFEDRIAVFGETEKNRLMESPQEIEQFQVEVARPDSKKKSPYHGILLTIIAALGGFLFGYDTGVVSGAILEIRSTFDLRPEWLEGIVSVTVASAAISAFLAGQLCDFLGRRPVLQMSSIVFTVGAALMGTSYYPWVLLLGRAVVGVGVGMAAMVVPMYIAETSSVKNRGMMVVFYALFVTGGQFVATVVDGAFSFLNYDVGWRVMLGLAGIPSLLMFFGSLFVPETPRWLVFHDKCAAAKDVLQTLRPHDDVKDEYNDIWRDFMDYSTNKMGCGSRLRRCVSSRSVLLALMVGCGLQVFQQLSGINTIMYYSASIIQRAGFSDRASIWLSTIPSSANFIFTIVGLFLVERLGRRKLLLGSCGGTIFSFILLAATFHGLSQMGPASVPMTNETCHFDHCGTCVGHSGCGFCADHVTANFSYNHGTCVPVKQLTNGTVASGYQSDTIICPVVDGVKSNEVEVWRHVTKNNSLEVTIKFPYPDNYEGKRLNHLDPSVERVWLPYGCPGNDWLAWLALLAVFLYIAFFAPGMGPLPWTLNSEIYPTWVRSMAISIATMMNWAFNLAVSLTFLTMADELGQAWTFGLYAMLSTLGMLFFFLFVPETKGTNLEDVEKLFQRPYFMNWFGNRIT